jgi:hypothetical protein
MGLVAKMTGQDLRKLRIEPGGDDGEAMEQEPENEPGRPHLQSKSESGGGRAVEDR